MPLKRFGSSHFIYVIIFYLFLSRLIKYNNLLIGKLLFEKCRWKKSLIKI